MGRDILPRFLTNIASICCEDCLRGDTDTERGRRSAVAACRSGKIEGIPKAPGSLLCAAKAIESDPMPR